MSFFEPLYFLKFWPKFVNTVPSHWDYRGVFGILTLWVLSDNKVFIYHPQFFITALKCTEIAGANSLFFKIAGAKALVHSTRAKYTPEVLKKYFTLFVQMCFTKTFQTNAKCNIINNV